MPRYVAEIDFKEWCGPYTNDVIARDTIRIEVNAPNIELAEEKVFEELLAIVNYDLESIDTNKWDCGDIEDTENGYSVTCYDKEDCDRCQEELCECHRHELVYELVSLEKEED